MIKFCRNIMVIVFFALICQSQILADLPKNGMVMVEVKEINQISSKRAPNNDRLSFAELVESGVNGIAYKSWAKATYYTYSEWVNEAHEHGLWVAGGTVNHQSNAAMVDYGSWTAAEGADFVWVDEPLKGWTGAAVCPSYGPEPFLEVNYKALKNSVAKACMHGKCQSLVTDVDCNANFSNWASLDGFHNEIYVKMHMDNYWNQLVADQAKYPNKFIGAWNWILTEYEAGAAFPDATFNEYFTKTFNQFKNVMFFIWDRREDLPKNSGDGVWPGTNWDSRTAKIKQVVQANGITLPKLPVWNNFKQSSTIQSAPDVEVQVQSAEVGLDPASVEVFYNLGPEIRRTKKWIKHDNVVVTGTGRELVTIKAVGVPFNQVSLNNMIRFKITDTYSGSYFRNARTTKYEQAVSVTALDWKNLSNDGVVNSLPGSLSIDVQNADGIDEAAAECEFSVDGGKTWTEHASSVTDGDSAGVKRVSVKDIPFVEDQAGINKIRFSIKTSSGTILKSTEFPVKVMVAPSYSALTISRTDAAKVDFSVKVNDASGMAIGTQASPLKEETVFLYPLSGDAKDASGNGFDGTLHGGASFKSTDSWKTAGGQIQALYLDGTSGFADFGHGSLGRSGHLTISAWVKAENGQAAINMGGIEALGSLQLYFASDKVSIVARGRNNNVVTRLDSDAGTFAHNKWYHVAVSYDGDEGRLFINGNLAASGDWTGYHIFQFKPFRLGMPGNRNRFFKGFISDMHLVSRALTEREIASEYYSGSYRTTSDGGATWTNWLPGTFDKTDGNPESVTLSATGAALSGDDDLMNQVQFAVRDVNGNAGEGGYMLMKGDVVDVMPAVTAIGAVNIYPNPFRHQTSVGFSMNSGKKSSLTIFGTDGKKVRSFTLNGLASGKNTIVWDGKGDAGQELNAGQYFVRLQAGTKTMVKKVLMLR
ncbi:MAG: T9SS type A sorting domain-containing protein [Fibrobacteria bacterium]|nr:T9SS type A sorting domain-containing protein [Fibrobacteria bacterium]